MKDLSSYRRVILGRNITLTAAAIYALTRAAYYATVNPDSVSPAQGVITGDGRLLGGWAAIWLVSAVLCIVDMVNKHTRHGLSMVAGLALGWGVAYAVIWGCTGFTDPSLISTAIGWITPSGLVIGFIIKVTALQDMVRNNGGEGS
jgi:hypothetical protein